MHAEDLPQPGLQEFRLLHVLAVAHGMLLQGDDICMCPLLHQNCFPSLAGLGDATGGRIDSLTNADAERVLLRVKQKLEGLEGGKPDSQAFFCEYTPVPTCRAHTWHAFRADALCKDSAMLVHAASR